MQGLFLPVIDADVARDRASWPVLPAIRPHIIRLGIMIGAVQLPERTHGVLVSNLVVRGGLRHPVAAILAAGRRAIASGGQFRHPALCDRGRGSRDRARSDERGISGQRL